MNSRTLSLLVCFSLFSRRLFKYRIGIDLDLFAYPLYILLLLYIFYVGKFKVKFAGLLTLFLALSTLPYMASGYPLYNYFKTVMPMMLIFTCLYSYLANKDLDDFFKDYITVSYWVAVFGIVQVVVKGTTGIGLFSPYPAIDLHSIVTEPSHYVVVILPALIYTFFSYKDYKVAFWLFLITLLLTLKLTAFLAIFIIFVLTRFKIIYLLFFIPIGYYGFNYLMTIPEYAFRLTPLVALVNGDEMPKVFSGTPLSLISNLLVAMDTASNNWGFGGGIGSHPYSHMRYYAIHEWPGAERQFGMNMNSGHALSIRMLSEFGYIGLSLITLFFVNVYRKVRKYEPYKIMYFACISHFVAKGIKLGAYIDYGTPIFFCIIVLLSVKMKERKKEQRKLALSSKNKPKLMIT